MEKIISILKENKIVQGALLVGGVAAAAVYLFKAAEQEALKVQEYTIEDIIKDTLKNAKVVKIQQYQLYDLDTFLKLTDICGELAIPEYKEYVFKNREQRRQLRETNLEKYYELIIECNNTVFTLIVNQMDKLLKYEGYDEKLMQVSYSAYSRHEVYMQNILGCIIQLKSSIANEEINITEEQAHEILEYQIKTMKSAPEILTKFLEFVKGKKISRGSIVSSIKTIVFDQIFLEKGIEEEDFLIPTKNEKFQKDPKSHKLGVQHSDAVMGLFQILQS